MPGVAPAIGGSTDISIGSGSEPCPQPDNRRWTLRYIRTDDGASPRTSLSKERRRAVHSVPCELLTVGRHQRSRSGSNPQRPESSQLELLGRILQGVAEELVRAQDFDSDLIADLVRARLAAARREIVEASGPPIEVIA